MYPSLFTKKSGFALFLAMALIFFGAMMLPWMYISGAKNQIVKDDAQTQKKNVAIVFGAGLTNGKQPSDVLYDRLKIAARLYENGSVKNILVSGDNSTADYSEPDVMKITLIEELNVPEDKVFVDYGGRRTYDTCIRAREIWGIESAILVTQEYHLPRAIWTCEVLGINNVGVSASLQPYVRERNYRQREILASYKAFIDLYIRQPKYIGGEFIQDIDK